MTKQTAVEWLIEQTRNPGWHSLKRGDIIEQAKEMEKEQIEKSFNEGWLQCNIYELPEKSRKHFKTANEYYYFTYTESTE